MIVKKIYTYAAPKFNNFFKRWKINQEYYESIWTFFKFLISDYFDLLAGYSLDYYIVLSLFITTYIPEDKSDLFESDFPGKINVNFYFWFLFHLFYSESNS